jgi:uncharacterized RDD family membrane protein YckC
MLCRNHVDVSQGVRRCARCGSPFCSDCLVTIHGRDYCAVCKNEEIMDVRSGTDTGVLPFASIGRRFVAQFLDGLVLWLAAIVLIVPVAVFMASGKKNEDAGAALIIVAILAVVVGYIAYEALMLASRGATLGKLAMKIRVVRADGGELSTGQAWGRAISRAVMVHVLALLNYGAALVTKEKTCLHDMLAKTRVVNAE